MSGPVVCLSPWEVARRGPAMTVTNEFELALWRLRVPFDAPTVR